MVKHANGQASERLHHKRGEFERWRRRRCRRARARAGWSGARRATNATTTPTIRRTIATAACTQNCVRVLKAIKLIAIMRRGRLFEFLASQRRQPATDVFCRASVCFESRQQRWQAAHPPGIDDELQTTNTKTRKNGAEPRALPTRHRDAPSIARPPARSLARSTQATRTGDLRTARISGAAAAANRDVCSRSSAPPLPPPPPTPPSPPSPPTPPTPPPPLLLQHSAPIVARERRLRRRERARRSLCRSDYAAAVCSHSNMTNRALERLSKLRARGARIYKLAL